VIINAKYNTSKTLHVVGFFAIVAGQQKGNRNPLALKFWLCHHAHERRCV